jgi:hypothetical protein
MATATLRLDAGDVDAQQRNQLTKSLFESIRALHLVTVARAEQAAPAGAKSGTGQSIAELVITGVLSTGTVTAIAKVITAYVERTKARSVTWVQDGREVTLTGIAKADQSALAAALAATAKPPVGAPEVERAAEGQ